MKKFIAILVTLTMIAAVGVTCVFAAEPTSIEVVCDVPTTPSTLSNGNLRYDITFKLNGITGNQLSWAGEFDDDEEVYNNFAGRSIDSIGLNLYLVGTDNPEDLVAATLKTGGGYYASGSVKATTFDGIAVEASGDRLYPSGEGEGTLNTKTSPFVTIRVTTKPGAVLHLVPQGTIEISNWSNGVVASSNVYSNETGSNLSFSASPIVIGASSTTAVTGVTLDKSALKLKVGGTYDLAETVAPNDATDKSVTYSSSNTSVATVDAATGVVTAVAVGTANITVTTTDGGKTATCAVTVYNDVVPAAADSKVVGSATTGLKDADGKSVTIDPSRSYGAAKFENINLGAYNYKIVATDADGNEKAFDIAEGNLEVSGTASFIAIVRSATHTITSVVLRAFNK